MAAPRLGDSLKAYEDFDLAITPVDGGYRVALRSPAGSSSIEVASLLPPEKAVGWLAALGRTGGESRDLTADAAPALVNREAAAKAIGRALHDAVFSGPIASCFAVSWDRCEAQDKGLRIVLRLGESPELTDLPWEFLYDAKEDRYLVHSALTPVVRYIEIEKPVNPFAVAPPLRILVLISNPKDQPQLQVDKEWRGLKESLAELELQGRVTIERIDTATSDALEKRLQRADKFHILHFIGHGGIDPESRQGALLFEDESGLSLPVDAKKLGVLVGDHRSLRLVLLNACRSARSGSEDRLSGMAQRLVHQGMPAVIAMQFPISDEAALLLSRVFYGALADFLPVDAALAQARRALFLKDFEVEWGTPVLFMRTPDGRVFIDDAAVSDERGLQPDAKQEPTAPTTTTDEKPAQTADVQAFDAPPKPEPLPTMPHFVGRETEIAYFKAKLEANHLAVITGMPGVGKTTLAAVLARQLAPADKTFWHAFAPGEGVDVIIWKLAAFLANHGEQRLWRLVEQARLEGHPPPPTPLLFDHLFPLLQGQGYLLCFDDVQHVSDDPQVDIFIKRLRDTVQAGELVLVVTSLNVPDFVQTTAFEALQGLTLADSQALLAARGVVISEDLVAALHTATEGNAQFLNLAANALLGGEDPQLLAERLGSSDRVEDYLFKMVDKLLRPADKEIMIAVAVLGRPASRQAVEAVLDGVRVGRPLGHLAASHLLTKRESPSGGEAYGLHSILRRHFYEHDDLTDADRRKLHGRAAAFYDRDGSEPLWAAQHFALAGEPARAAELTTSAFWRLVNRGQAREADTLLARLRKPDLPPLLWVDVNIARGMLGALLGSGAVARPCLDEALRVLEGMPPDEEVRLRQAQACRGIGEGLHYEAPSEAQKWFGRGLEAVAAGGAMPDGAAARMEAAAMEMKMGAVHMLLKDNGPALESLERALALLPDTPTQVRGNALISLAAVHGQRGDLEHAQQFSLLALQVSDALQDDFLRIDPQMNLGIIAELEGNWDEAKRRMSGALEIAMHLGDVARQAKAAVNLGILETNRGADAEAEKYLLTCIELARRSRLQAQLMNGLTGLADLRLRQGRPNDAEPLLAEAQGVVQMLQARGESAELLRLKAEIYLARGDQGAAAAAAAEEAVAAAGEFCQSAELGKSLRVLGEIQLAGGASGAAMASFERSTALLSEEEPYEAARTRLRWGAALVAAGEGRRGEALLREALLVFRGLGAVRDVAAAAVLAAAS